VWQFSRGSTRTKSAHGEPVCESSAARRADLDGRVLWLTLFGFGCILVVSRNMSTLQTPVVHSDPEVMSGTPVFVGTRVPFQTLIDYLEAGQPLSEFLEDFPTVSKEQAIAALEQAKNALLARADPA
jgi:uncharacterized protein (DUF433 family)